MFYQLNDEPLKALDLYETYIPRASTDGGIYTDAIHRGFEAVCRGRMGLAVSTVPVIRYASLLSEGVAIDALRAASLMLADPKNVSLQENFAVAYGVLQSPIHAGSPARHDELNLTVRVVCEFLRPETKFVGCADTN